MDRRALLKTLAVAPFLTWAKPAITSIARPFATDMYIFLHGFFFMEYQGNHLVVIAPEVSDHDYQIGLPDAFPNETIKYSLKSVPSNTTLDWTGSLIGDDQCSSKSFPKQILQFSRIDTARR